MGKQIFRIFDRNNKIVGETTNQAGALSYVSMHANARFETLTVDEEHELMALPYIVEKVSMPKGDLHQQ